MPAQYQSMYGLLTCVIRADAQAHAVQEGYGSAAALPLSASSHINLRAHNLGLLHLQGYLALCFVAGGACSLADALRLLMGLCSVL